LTHAVDLAAHCVEENQLARSSLRWVASAALAPYPKFHRPIQKLYNVPTNVLAKFRYSEQQVLSQIANRKQNVSFVQVGANDGKTEDYLYDFVHEHGWRGVLVEPVKPVFEKLVKNYDGIPGLIFENVAISEQDGMRTFYRLKDDKSLPHIATMIGSFDRAVLLRTTLFPILNLT
jgi:hypothetical protein